MSKYKIWLDATDRYVKKILIKDLSDVLVLEKSGDLDLVASIQAHCADPASIELVEFNKGPGSFTGLRVSAAISNTINWLLGKKTVSELDYPEYGREANITMSNKNSIV